MLDLTIKLSPRDVALEIAKMEKSEFLDFLLQIAQFRHKAGTDDEITRQFVTWWHEQR